MRNPLRKRLARDLRQEIGKYIATFLFLVIFIGFSSGFYVADGSMKKTYDESFEKFNIEDGRFFLASELEDGLKEEIEELGVKVYPIYFKDKTIADNHLIRIYQNREDINKVDLLEGKLPHEVNQIALDRVYANNNNIEVGDSLEIEGHNMEVSGIVALSDYSALFKNNSDIMFDGRTFSVAVVTEEGVKELGPAGLTYQYSWINEDKDLSKDQVHQLSEDVKSRLIRSAMVTDFAAREDNQVIVFTGNDMGSDKVLMSAMLYMIIGAMAFVFAITTKNTIESEASVIGTLRASGYTRGEMVAHYIKMPVIVTIVSALVGNILGYTYMRQVVTNMYYNSYSLPTYTTTWSGEAFLLTTLVPVIIVIIVNSFILWRGLSLGPLDFLRHELKKNRNGRTMKLKRGSFFTRFRIRIILQNLTTYIAMLLGILLASQILVFGLMLSPLLEHLKEETKSAQMAEYQYILKAPVETGNQEAEKYAVKVLKSSHGEEVTVYGISSQSKYLPDVKVVKDGMKAVFSQGYLDKFGLKTGDKVTLGQEYCEEKYQLEIIDTYYYPGAFVAYMDIDEFNKAFDNEEGYFNGYFSNEEITDIDGAYIATTITASDLTVLSDQMENSMGGFFVMMGVFGVAVYILLTYLLAKLVVEKNTKSISMLKILGYQNREADRLYNVATAIVVVISLLVSVPIGHFTVKTIFYLAMKQNTGWMDYYVAPWVYPAMVVIGMLCYLLVHLIQRRKIGKIHMSQALKTME